MHDMVHTFIYIILYKRRRREMNAHGHNEFIIVSHVKHHPPIALTYPSHWRTADGWTTKDMSTRPSDPHGRHQCRSNSLLPMMLSFFRSFVCFSFHPWEERAKSINKWMLFIILLMGGTTTTTFFFSFLLAEYCNSLFGKLTKKKKKKKGENWTLCIVP